MLDSAKTTQKEKNKTRHPFKVLISEIIILTKIAKRNLPLFFVLTIIGGIIGYYYSVRVAPIYKADLKFVMKSDANGITSSISSLSSMLGGSSSANQSPLDRIMELITSEKIVGNALLRNVSIDRKEDLLINHFIKHEQLKTKWQKDSLLAKIVFNKNSKYDNLSLGQRKAIKIITKLVTGSENITGGIISKKYERKSGVIVLTAQYENEIFAIELVNSIYKELINFYIDQTVYTTNNNVQILTKKVDSIKSELNATQRRYAQNLDQSLGLLLQKDKVENKSLAIKEQMLIAMFAEAQKNLETLRFMEASTIPSFAIIDQPYSPIEPIRMNKLKSTLIGVFSFSVGLLILLRVLPVFKRAIKE